MAGSLAFAETFTNDATTTATGSSGTTSPVSGTQETWIVSSSTGFPAVLTANGTGFHVADPALPTEKILVTNITGTTWTVIRGDEGTTPLAHTTGFTIRQVLTAGFLNRTVVFVVPSGDTTGVTDAANLAAANNALAVGGNIRLGPGSFYLKTNGLTGAPAWTPSAQTVAGTAGGNPVSVDGAGRGATTIFIVGDGPGIYYHRTSGYGAQFGLPAQPTVGHLRDFTIDLTNAGIGTTGLDVGDGWGHDVYIDVVNGTGTQSWTATNASPCVFTVAKAPANGFPILLSGNMPGGFIPGQLYYVVNRTATTFQLQLAPFSPAAPLASTSTGSGTHNATVPWRITNQVFWTEKGKFRLISRNNSIAGVLDTLVPGSDHSHEYCDLDFDIFCSSNQQGIVCAAGVNINGRMFHVQGNMANSSAVPFAYTATNANPCVFTATGSAFTNGSQLVLGTGAPTGFSTTTLYYVVAASGATFQLSATPGGAAIASTSTGSGTLTPAPTNNIAMLTFSGRFQASGGDFSRIYGGTLRTKVEGNQGDGPANGIPPYGLYSDGLGYIRECDGRVAHSLSQSQWNGAEFSLHGAIQGDPGLAGLYPGAPGSQSTIPGLNATTSGQPAVPATTVLQQNYGPDMMVYVTAPAAVACTVQVNATNVVVPANGTMPFFVNAGGSIKLTYASGSPSWIWVPAAQLQY